MVKRMIGLLVVTFHMVPDYASTAAMSIISQSEKDDASKYMMHAWQGSSRYNALRPESSATRRKRAICPNGREAKKN